MVFIDGLGIAPVGTRECPLSADTCPHLLESITAHSCAVDAHLGVPGLPQSATGQTAMLTGVNAAHAMKRHIEGFPGPGLCRIIVKHNIFSKLVSRGYLATFANGYFLESEDEARRLRLRSVTTVSTLSALGSVRNRAMLERNQAVYQDLTREALVERGYTGPLVTPQEAAEHLLTITDEHHFTLFEYFQTDRAGHTGDMQKATEVLKRLDVFIGALLENMDRERLRLIITSDHGNIEDLSTRRHTHNPVPFCVIGPDAEALRADVQTMTHITPAILKQYP